MKVLRFTSILLTAISLTACNTDIVTDDMEPENMKTLARRKIQNNGEPGNGGSWGKDDRRGNITVNAGTRIHVEENGFRCAVSWDQKTLRDFDANNRLRAEMQEGTNAYYTGSDTTIVDVNASAEFEGIINISQNVTIKATFTYTKRIYKGYDPVKQEKIYERRSQSPKVVRKDYYLTGVDNNDYSFH